MVVYLYLQRRLPDRSQIGFIYVRSNYHGLILKNVLRHHDLNPCLDRTPALSPSMMSPEGKRYTFQVHHHPLRLFACRRRYVPWPKRPICSSHDTGGFARHQIPSAHRQSNETYRQHYILCLEVVYLYND
jgi:hypothetical protein